MAYRAAAELTRPFSYVSDGVLGLTGLQAEAFSSGRMTWLAIVHPEDLTTVAREVENALRERRGFSLVHRIVHATDGVRWVLDRCELVADQQGKHDAFEGFVTDVTDLRRDQEALRDSEARLRYSFEHATIGLAHVCLIELGHFIRVNDRLCEMTGYSRDELLARSFQDITHPADLQENLELARRLRAGEITTFSLQKRYVRKHGQIFWANLTASVVPGPTGEPDYAVSVIEDITDRMRAEAALRVAQAAGGVGLFDLQIATREARCSEHLFKVVGRTLPPGRTVTCDEATGWIHPDDRDRAMAEIGAALDSADERMSSEFRVVGEDAEARWISYQAEIRRDPDGHAARVLGAIQDITIRKRSEEQLRQAHERLSLALHAGQAGLWDWELKEGGSGFLSPETRDLYGATSDEPASYERWLAHIHPEDRERVAAHHEDAFAHGADISIEFRILHPTRGVRWIGCKGRLYRDADGRPVRYSGINVDITAMKRVEQALRESEQRFREADRRKDVFLATLAHELRNPLAPLRTGCEVMQGSSDRGTRERAREMMERQLDHMVRLVDDLLDVSRISRDKVELKRETIPLQVAVRHAVETASPLIRSRRQVLASRVPDEPVWVDGDVTRLSQVIGNLLNNGTKFTPEGGHLEIAVSVEGGRAVIRVTDDGVGISPEMLPTVFDLFAQAECDRGRAHGGLGIGLFLVRRLVEMHGGTIAAESPGVGRGSTFTIRFPLVAAPRPEVAGAGAAGPHVEAAKRRILVVDDNEDAAELLATVLDLHGYETRIANDGPSALEAARAFVPEVAFLDLGLPGMSGHDLARELRSDPALAGTVLVALTGWGGEEDKRRTREAGFNYHLTKPVAVAAIEDVLAHC